MRPLFNDLPPVKDNNIVCIFNCTKPMSHDYYGLSLKETPHLFHNDFLIVGIQ